MLNQMAFQLDRLNAKRLALAESDRSAKVDSRLSLYTRIMTKVTDTERCSVFIHDPERDRIWLKAGTGVEEQEIEVPKEDSIVGKVIASGKPVVVTNLDTKSGTHKKVDETTGAFQLLNKINDEKFTDEDISFAQEIAEHLQVEVDRVYLDQEIFGLSKRIYSTARKTMAFLFAAVTIAFVMAFLALVAWGALPGLFGD